MNTGEWGTAGRSRRGDIAGLLLLTGYIAGMVQLYWMGWPLVWDWAREVWG